MVKDRFLERGIYMKKWTTTYLSIPAILVASFILWGAPEAIAQQYRLTVERRGEGSGAVSDHRRNTYGEGVGSMFNQGTKITLKAEADQDSFFEGWEGGGCSGARTCTVTMDSDISVTAVFGTADKVPQVSYSPTSLDFGKVKIKKSGTKALTISNTGTGDLKGSVGFFTGGGGAFTISGTNNFTLKPNKKKAVTVKFQPTTIGIQNSALGVTSNDPSSPVVTVFLQGEGVCDKDLVVAENYELEISADITFATLLNPTFKGKGRIPIEVHSCQGVKTGVQVVGTGKLDLAYSAAGAGCTETGTMPLDILISPSRLGVLTPDFAFIKSDFPGSRFQGETCCEGDPGCDTIAVDFPGILGVETEIGLNDGDTATKVYTVDIFKATFIFTMHLVQ
jgi:hypothetical protein